MQQTTRPPVEGHGLRRQPVSGRAPVGRVMRQIPVPDFSLFLGS